MKAIMRSVAQLSFVEHESPPPFVKRGVYLTWATLKPTLVKMQQVMDSIKKHFYDYEKSKQSSK